ncbi:hypothetical protein L226DRAFT_219533 [Lentinus tigrinus ALCF2SS1-7]|uniref:Uncharacterized protein n=1 Tax=Lentinus tigrinus ALCF2SS1-6 TaxID=1328759 RepID=A0A5C2S6Q3_9APHY|nr:hypothetical protein L227DRAFT_159588 [Lentinus tigrinus ALCF2SS1-6]RPD70760.1 hypothetical protein L226DRAFT_219533 [Lentinus tigrinus ALCF2SS1-7]
MDGSVMNGASPVHIEDMTRVVLSQLEREAPELSGDTIKKCLELLANTASHLSEVANARVPFCALPIDILNQIMEAITDPLELSKEDADFRFEPFWLSAARNSDMLVPITRTCRYLRKVALSNPLLWKTLTTHSTPSIPFSQLQRLCDGVPLTLVVAPSKDFTNILDAFYPSHAHHVRELHFTEIGHRHINYVRSLMQHSTPALTSYAFCGRTGDISKWPTHELPLPLTSAALLRDLYIRDVPLLPSIALPHLTHLALSKIEMRGLHTAVANVLSLCPNLEALVLAQLFQIDSATPDPQPLHMKKLRRLTLYGMTQTSLQYYLTLLPRGSPQSATQLLSSFETASVLPNGTFENTTRIAFTYARPATPSFSRPHHTELTMTTPDRVVHVVQELMNRSPLSGLQYALGGWYEGLSVHSARLSQVREVWFTNMCRANAEESQVVHSIVALLPALETLVITEEYAGNVHPVSPNLSLCPSAHDPSFQSRRLKNLRIACGLSSRSDPTHSYVLYALLFADMLAQLKTGAYDYLEHLVVLAVRQLVISEADLAQLREHFSTVKAEYVDVLPGMPVPACCNEPRAGIKWTGALW